MASARTTDSTTRKRGILDDRDKGRDKVLARLKRWLERHDARDTVLPRIGYCQTAILLAIAALDAEAYGARIIDWLGNHIKPATKKINEGQIYATLRHLVAEGFLVQVNVVNPSGKGRRVVVYCFTRRAHHLLEAMLFWMSTPNLVDASIK